MVPKIQKIEEAICRLEAGEYQIFCDNYLRKKENLFHVLDYGKKAGTAKTIKGNPDFYAGNANGKYVLATYTTQQSDLYNKIREDILKCFDIGLEAKDIEKIICCHTSSRLKPEEDKKLNMLCKEKGIPLTIYSAEDMAYDVLNKYQPLGKEFLGIPIDTDQIMSAEDFIKDYDANETAAPIDTIFQNRKKELPELIEAIRKNRVVVVYGPAGVGKTRLVLEATKTIAKEDGYELLCVRNKGMTIFDDLVSRTEEKGKYLFFVDDANELTGLGSILELLKKNKAGYDIRIVLTVRDYVKEKVTREVFKHCNETYLLEVPSFSDAEITDFLAVNMKITNKQYVNAILVIAEGNPRVAYMAGKLAIEKKSLASLHDVTGVYEQYYANVIQQTGLGKDKNLCLTAGILALVKTVMLDRLDGLDEILKVANLSKYDFTECVRQLSLMEVVEIKEEKVAYISDQCFGNYMLYYVFLDQKRIPLSTVLSIGFSHFKESVIQAVNVLWNLFAREELRDYVGKEVSKAWDHLKEAHAPCFYEFAQIFHEFRPEESFVMASEKIKEIPQEEVRNQRIEFEKGIIEPEDGILNLLTGYSLLEERGYFNTALKLVLKYAEKSELNSINAFKWLKNQVGVLPDSYRYDYYAEQEAIKVLHEHLKDNLYVQKLILAYVSYLLRFCFKPMTFGRKQGITMYNIPLNNSEGVKKVRQECWQILKELFNEQDLQDDIFDVMEKYSEYLPRAQDKSIVLDDQPCCWKLVQSLKCSDISKALIIRDLQHSWSNFGISYSNEVNLFQSEKWKLFVLLEEDWANDNLDPKEYMEQREEKLDNFADSLSAEDFPAFVRKVRIIWEELGSSKQDSILSGVDIVIRRVLENKVDPWIVFTSVLRYSSDIRINAEPIFCSLFKEQDSKKIWEELVKHDFASKNTWEFTFFDTIQADKVDRNTFELLLAFLKSNLDRNIKDCPRRNMFFLDKFIHFDKDIFVTASRIIWAKKSYSSYIVLRYFSSLFDEDEHSPEEVLARFSSDEKLLREIYFFVLGKINFSDYDCVFLKKFLSSDKAAIDEYAEFICEYTVNNYSFKSDFSHQFHELWLEADYQIYFDHIFDVVSENKELIPCSPVSTLFKAILQHEEKDTGLIQKQKDWVLHIIEKYAKVEKKMICLFYGLSEVDSSLRLTAFEKLLDLNSDFQLFKKLSLVPLCYFGNTSEIISELQSWIDFLKSLNDSILARGDVISYLQHSDYISKEIDIWKAHIHETEIDAILQKLNY